MKVLLTKPYIGKSELKHITALLRSEETLAGDGVYSKKVSLYFKNKYKVNSVLLTTSASTALELAVRLCNLQKGDEVILPSFTFPSTANAVLLASGAKVVFADIDFETLNIDPKDIKRKITGNTKAIIIVHYAGVSCDMDEILRIAKKHKLKVIEDAAQGIGAKYKGKYLGTIGDFGVLSFHDTKNIVCGEGGALFINSKDKRIIEKAEILRQKGTNRTKFLRGEVNKYEWVDVGSSYLLSDILAAFLLGQLENIDFINEKRMKIYQHFAKELKPYAARGQIRMQKIPKGAKHNAHIFAVLFEDEQKRNAVMKFLKERGVLAVFHFLPLHASPQGRSLGFSSEEDYPVSSQVASTLLRIPLYAQMTNKERDFVIANVIESLNTIPSLK